MKEYLKHIFEGTERYEAINELLDQAINLHNSLDSFVLGKQNLIVLEGNEKLFNATVKLYGRFLTFMEEYWQEMLKQLNINPKDKLEATNFHPIGEFIENHLEEARDDFESFVEMKHIHHLHGYSYLHEIIGVLKQYDF